ncbi:hypothetical protein [Paraflavitalea sp. CAU 1676]|uniref:hypothetical protein n=1 Tax=Paraflavitalea sp. CAU 1676 TaxID=3032598 RepID=UPI0023DAC482|nr:hypothetical protein [Paraflavitalea sp. CAU 1676]MDF2188955.1 hypothetical protein [Paraflavitalea sp. CAU 1676]
MTRNERYTVTYLKLLVAGDRFRFGKLDLLHSVEFANGQGVEIYNMITRQKCFYTKAVCNKEKVLKIL